MSGKTARQALRITPRQRMELALEIDHALRTVDGIYAGRRSLRSCYDRTVRGAKKLGFPLPPPHSSSRAVDLDCDRMKVQA